MKTSRDFNRELIRLVKPTMSYAGNNYEVWKAQSRAKLCDLIGMDKFEKVDADLKIEYEAEIEGSTEIRFSFQTEAGYRVPCHMLLPIGIDKPPVMIALQGHSSGMHISLGRAKYPGDEDMIHGGDRDFCIRAVKEGFATIALEQRNFGECAYTHEGIFCLESALTALLSGRTTIGERVWDVMRLIDLLESAFSDRIDTSTICCMGNSGGGTATAYIAALEDRIVLAMPSCAMCTYKDSIGAMYHCPCNYVPNIANYFDMNDLIAMAYPKLYVQVSGKEDDIFPINGAREVFQKGSQIYKENGIADKCVLIEGNGGHRFYADEAWNVVHRILDKKASK